MTTYNAAAVADSVIAYQKGITLQQGRALRDNPLAQFEGASGAPRLQFAALDTWYLTAGAVGTYCFGRAGSNIAFGSTVAGSTLFPTSAGVGIVGSGAGSPTLLPIGSSLSGTWRCMGTFTVVSGATSNDFYGATLWVRIA